MMISSASDERSLGRYWGSGRFSASDASALHAKVGRALGARLVGALQLATDCGCEATRRSAIGAIDTLRGLGPDARRWLLTHPITAGAVREIMDELAAAHARDARPSLADWLGTRFGDLVRGASLVTGGEVEWEAAGPSVIPGIGLRIEGALPEQVAIRREAASLVISRRTMGHVRVPLAEALPGQWMAVGHDLALPSFAIGGARVHVDAEDRVFRERWRREVRFGALEVTMPPRLQLAKWTCALDAAARVAEATVPLSSSLFGGIVRTVVPIISPDPEMGCSLSDRDMPGAIMTTIDRPAVLAENILHEFRHNLLHQIEQAYPLYLVDSPEEARFYSPWRPDPRPLHGILHALFVFLDVCAVHAGVRTAALGGDPDMHDSAVRLAANVRRIGIALQEFRAHARTTEFGTGFVEGIEEAVGRFLPLVAALPTEALQEADGLVEQHRANWTGVG